MVYTVRRVSKPEWDKIPAVELQHQPWEKPCDISAKAQACCDGEKLFVRLEAKEAPIRATMNGPLCDIWCDSCLEFFFAPEADDDRYFNFEWNPLGSVYFGFGAKNRVRQIVDDQAAIFDPKPFRTDGGWGIEFRVPIELIRVYFPEFVFNGIKAGNFYKCGDDTVIPHFLAWKDMNSETPNFHRREDFGTLIFE